MNKVNPDNSCAQLIKNVEYRKDALQFMFNMQRNLQEFIANKKGGIGPGKGNYRDEIDLSIYYFGCTTTEFFEFGERLNDFEWDWNTIDTDEKLEIQYEYIDMWHFIMNQFLYTNINVDNIEMTLEYIYEAETHTSISSRYDKNDLITTTEMFWSNFSYLWGKYLNNLPYKKWKDYNYDAMKEVNMLDQEFLMRLMIINFVKFGEIIDIDYKHFFNLYVSKNKENINRQEPGGVYYSA